MPTGAYQGFERPPAWVAFNAVMPAGASVALDEGELT